LTIKMLSDCLILLCRGCVQSQNVVQRSVEVMFCDSVILALSAR